MTFTDLSETLESLYLLQRRGIKMGLDHTFRLLEFLKNPQNNLTIIHIAGTNGKGSTAAIIYNILKQHGSKVGLYTSPHLINFNERIRINGIPISDQEILSFMIRIRPAIKRIKSTFFEVTTAMALDHFNQHKVDVAVIETGLGGRLDSTNVVNPALTIMTPISMDHIDILGNTIEEIANEKAGIIKQDVTLITARQKQSVMEVLENKAKLKNAYVRTSDEHSNFRLTSNGTNFELSEKKFHISLMGEHQANNAALAITSLIHFDNTITYETIFSALKSVFWPGRLQLVSDGIYYDVAHNSQGIKSVFKNLNTIFPRSGFYGLLCLKGDKDIQGFSEYFNRQFKKLFVTTDSEGLLLKPMELSNKLNDLNVNNSPLDSISIGIDKINQIKKPNDIILIFGTHYVAKEVYQKFEISFDSGVI